MTDATTLVQYPVWQEEIRAAQAQVQAVLDADRAETLKQAAEVDRKLAVLLEGALDLYGIPSVEPLTTNQVQLDNLRFSISRYSRNAEGNPALLRPTRSSETGDEIYDFSFEVSYMLTGIYAQKQDSYDNYDMFRALTVLHNPDNPDWSQEKAELADAIDRVTVKGQQFITQVDEWQAQEAKPKPFVHPEPFERQLAYILREMVREMVEQHFPADYAE